MRILKKISLISFGLIIVLLLIGNININASPFEVKYNQKITVQGASIRTSGSEGIRFECKNADNTISPVTISKYGVLIAFGDVSDYNSIIAASNYNQKINDRYVLNAYCNEADENGIYYVTIYDIPSGFFLQDITVFPYMEVNNSESSEIVYGNSVLTRNLGEIALAYLNDGGEKTTLIDGILCELQTTYRKKVNDGFGHVYIDSLVYESDINYIYEEFINDWYKEYGVLLDEYNFFEKLYDVKVVSRNDANIVKFFNKYHDKYGWLLTTIQELSPDGFADRQAAYLYDNTYIVDDDHWNFAGEFVVYLISLFTCSDSPIDKPLNENTEAYKKIALNNNGVYTNLLDSSRNYGIIKNDSSTTLPSLNSNIEVGKWVSYEYYPLGSTDPSTNKYYENSNIKLELGCYYYFYELKIMPTVYTYLTGQDLNGAQTYVEKSNYTIDGGSYTVCNGEIVLSNKTEKVIFKNIEFENVKITCETPDEDDLGCILKNVQFINCTFENGNETFIQLIANDYTYTEDILFNNCTFENGNDGGILLTNNKGLTLKECSFDTLAYIPVIVNSSMYGCGELGTLTVDTCDFFTTSNTSNIGDAINVEYLNNERGASILIKNSEFSFNGEFGSALQIGAESGYDNNSITFTNNTIPTGRIARAQFNTTCTIDGVDMYISSSGVFSVN